MYTAVYKNPYSTGGFSFQLTNSGYEKERYTFGLMYPFATANTANFIMLSYPVLLRTSVMTAFTEPPEFVSWSRSPKPKP